MGIVSTRLDDETEDRVNAAAVRQGSNRSDWMRTVVVAAIDSEGHAADQAHNIADFSSRLASIEDHFGKCLDLLDRTTEELTTLSRRLAIDSAANEVVAIQTYRMAIRAAYVSMKSAVAQLPPGDRDKAFQDLLDEADEVCDDDALPRLREGMRNAREERQQAIQAGETSSWN